MNPKWQELLKRKEQCYLKVRNLKDYSYDKYSENYIEQIKIMISAIKELTQIVEELIDSYFEKSKHSRLEKLECLTTYLSLFSDKNITNLADIYIDGKFPTYSLQPPSSCMGFDLAYEVFQNTHQDIDMLCTIVEFDDNDGCIMLNEMYIHFNYNNAADYEESSDDDSTDLADPTDLADNDVDVKV